MENQPDLTGEKQADRDGNGRFMEGVSGNPHGRPRGSLSITTTIKRYYESHTEEFEALCKELREDKNMRKLLWSYIDGKPRESFEVNGEVKLPTPILADLFIKAEGGD